MTLKTMTVSDKHCQYNGRHVGLRRNLFFSTLEDTNKDIHAK